MTHEAFIKSVDDYIVDRKSPSSFVRSILQNDLMTAVQVVDDQSISNLRSFCRFVDRHVPRQVFGSAEKVDSWLNDNFDPNQRQGIIDTYLERKEAESGE